MCRARWSVRLHLCARLPTSSADKCVRWSRVQSKCTDDMSLAGSVQTGKVKKCYWKVQQFASQTPLRKHLCMCPSEFKRDPQSGKCGSGDSVVRECTPGNTNTCKENQQCVRRDDGELSNVFNTYDCCLITGSFACVCLPNFVWHARAQKCVPPDWCEPGFPEDCDKRKKEQCRPSSLGYGTCQCPDNHARHPVTGLCCE